MADILTVTPADNGRSLDVPAGATVRVRLPENPTTGYRWELVSPPTGPLELAGDTFELAGEPAVGSGGTREFRFRASAPGRARLVLELRRSWAGEQPPLERFSIDLTVAE